MQRIRYSFDEEVSEFNSSLIPVAGHLVTVTISPTNNTYILKTEKGLVLSSGQGFDVNSTKLLARQNLKDLGAVIYDEVRTKKLFASSEQKQELYTEGLITNSELKDKFIWNDGRWENTNAN